MRLVFFYSGDYRGGSGAAFSSVQAAGVFRLPSGVSRRELKNET